MGLLTKIKDHVVKNKGKYLTAGTAVIGGLYLKNKTKDPVAVMFDKSVSFAKEMTERGVSMNAIDAVMNSVVFNSANYSDLKNLDALLRSLSPEELKRTNNLASVASNSAYLLDFDKPRADEVILEYQNSSYYQAPSKDDQIPVTNVGNLNLSFMAINHFKSIMPSFIVKQASLLSSNPGDVKMTKILSSNYFKAAVINSIVLSANNFNLKNNVIEADYTIKN